MSESIFMAKIACEGVGRRGGREQGREGRREVGREAVGGSMQGASAIGLGQELECE